MYIYCVAFRIAAKTVNGKTYDERRQSVIDSVRVSEQGFWDELTSLFLVQSSFSTADLAKKASAGLSKADDLLIVFDPSDMSLGHFGNFSDAEILESFFRVSRRV